MIVKKPLISVVIPTYNRAELLRQSLSSFKSSKVDPQDYEIIVVDDGSTDDTREITEVQARALPIKYFFQKNSGIAASKNHGLFAAVGTIILFFDDDDLATPLLLKEHLKSHSRHPEENVAVLNYTTWAPGIPVTPLMHFITNEGGLQFAYPLIRHGQFLDFTFFWGGRASCKRSFLVRHGIFDPVFRFGNEDVELGYRLSNQGFKVFFNKKAVSYMNRPVGFDEFIDRCRRQGQAHYFWGSKTADPWVREWCLLDRLPRLGPQVKNRYAGLLDYARKIDSLAAAKEALGFPFQAEFKRHLYNIYGEIFQAAKIKGLQEAAIFSDPVPFSGKGQKAISFTIVAIICAFNEGDIIYHVLKHLIENGIQVYLLDHHSTDNTVAEASRWLGKGLRHIEKFPEESGFPEADPGVFSLSRITQRVEQLHTRLGADWYIHYDADEFREPPWPGVNLKEAIHLVDTLGFNAINFEYLNFWPTDDSFIPGEDVRQFIHHYEPAEDLDKPRINAWKNFGQEVNLTTFMGHKVCFEGLKVFPLQFINRHYRIRSREHGLRKVFQERLRRFDREEKAAGSHRHYDTLDESYDFIKDPSRLTRYDPVSVRSKLWFKTAFNAGK